MIKILQGDAVAKLKEIDDDSINTCVTSPPYWGLRDYGQEDQLGLEETPEEFIDNMVRIFSEVKRCLRDDGTLWLNLGDSYYNYRPGSGQSIARKHSFHNEVKGTPEKCSRRANKLTGLKEKDLVGIPWRVALALQADGWYLRQDIIWHKPNPMPESVRDRCTKAHEYIFLLSKKPKYYYDHEAIKEDAKYPQGPNSPQSIKKGKDMFGMDTRGGLSKIGALAKKNKRSVWTVTTKPFKGAHFATFPQDLIEPCILAGCPEKICVDCGTPYKREMQKTGEFQRRWSKTIATAEGSPHEGQSSMQNIYKDLGFKKQCDCQTNATKIGTVLDPFAGSGTTGLVANNHKRNAVLIELNPDYIKIIKERCGVEYP